MKAAYGDIASPKSFVHRRRRVGLSVNARKAIQTDVYTVTVKTNGTKTVQSRRNNDLLSFQLHLIIDFVVTERKLTHGPVKFPAHSISHFAMNIIMANTGSTAKVNPPNDILSAIRQNIFPPKFPAIRYIKLHIYLNTCQSLT